MKRKLTILFLCLTGLTYGQSFEGTLTYKTDFEVAEKMIKMGMTKEKLITSMKQEGTYSDTTKISYKQGNYYTIQNSKPKSWTIYKADVGKIYTMQDGESKDICTVLDATIDLESTMTGKMPSVLKLDTTVLNNNSTCYIVSVKWKSGTYDYYYDPTKLTVKPALFEKHTYDGWAEFLKISNSLPFKIVKTTKGIMTVTMTLVSTKTETINDKIFTIPNLIPDKNLNIIKTANREYMRIKKVNKTK